MRHWTKLFYKGDKFSMDTMEPDSPFQDWLQDQLDKRGWNMAELARQVSAAIGREVKQSAISQIMLRKNRLGAKMAIAIAKGLGVSEDIVLEKGGLKSPNKNTISEAGQELLNIFDRMTEDDQQLLTAHARTIDQHRNRRRNSDKSGNTAKGKPR